MIEIRLRGRLPSASAAYDAAQELGRQLCERHQLEALEMVVNANRTRVLSWRLGRQARVSVHWALLPFPDQVLATIDRTPGAWEALRTHLPTAPPPSTLSTAGSVHDLDAHLEAQRTHLPTAPDLQITWGQWPRRPPHRSIRLGSCAPPLVRIHPVLDHDTVPDWFVGFVVFHEMLHAVIPPRVENGRRKVHPPEFRRAEAHHPDFGRAMQWEEANVVALLRRCRQHTRAR